MPDYLDSATAAGDRFLMNMARYQDAWLRNLAAFGLLMPRMTPMAWPGFIAIREMSEAGFAFSEKLLEQQKSYAERWLDAIGSGIERPSRAGKRARPATPRKTSSRKATVQKATSKKTGAGKTGPMPPTDSPSD
jgi:hypothetical protein